MRALRRSPIRGLMTSPGGHRTFRFTRPMTALVEYALRVVRRRIARPLFHGLRRPLLMRRMARPSEVRLLGHRLRTEPGVFHPLYFSSSRILAEHVVAREPRGL